MATWYKTGTVDFTNGSTAVSGTGTAFNANVQIGDVIYGADNYPYEITAVGSDTDLTIDPTYLAANSTGTATRTQPTRGWTKRVLDELDSSNADVTDMLAGPGAGKFDDGTLAAPGVGFKADGDTGLRRVSSNKVALVAGGADKLAVTGNVATGDVVQSSATDDTPGKLLTVGAFGLGNGTSPIVTDPNSVVNGGIYSIADLSTSVNTPPGLTVGAASLLVLPGHNGNNATQMVTAQNGLGVFVRHYRAAVWSDWREVLTLDALGDFTIADGVVFADVSAKRVGINTLAPLSEVSVDTASGDSAGQNITARLSPGGTYGNAYMKLNAPRNSSASGGTVNGRAAITLLGNSADNSATLWLNANTSSLSPNTENDAAFKGRQAGLRISSNGAIGFWDSGVEKWGVDAGGNMNVDGGYITLNGNQVGGEQMIIADDAVGSFTLPRNGGGAMITCNGNNATPNRPYSELIWFDVGSTPDIAKISAIGTQLAIITTDVTGTTGDDGNVTVAVQAGVLKIENRTGGPKTFQVSGI